MIKMWNKKVTALNSDSRICFFRLSNLLNN